jgi:hypothetical protein
MEFLGASTKARAACYGPRTYSDFCVLRRETRDHQRRQNLTMRPTTTTLAIWPTSSLDICEQIAPHQQFPVSAMAVYNCNLGTPSISRYGQPVPICPVSVARISNMINFRFDLLGGAA